MADSSIEWTDKTWNPVRGCSLISPGCANCYAMKFAHRFSAPGQPYEGLTRLRSKGRGPVWTGEARFIREMLEAPLTWKKPARIFVNSMSDLFHEDVSFEQIAAVFGVMASCPQHTFQVLTKRAERMTEFFRWLGGIAANHGPWPTFTIWTMAQNLGIEGAREAPSTRWPLPNVWLGVSVENQSTANERIPHLLEVPARVRFLSCEPLLESIDLTLVQAGAYGVNPLHTIQWVIVGGESGHSARPLDLAWARQIRHQCKAAGVPFFFKQAGACPLLGGAPLKVRDPKGGDPTEWPEDLRERAFPEVKL